LAIETEDVALAAGFKTDIIDDVYSVCAVFCREVAAV